jgi:hypothetical protein
MNKLLDCLIQSITDCFCPSNNEKDEQPPVILRRSKRIQEQKNIHIETKIEIVKEQKNIKKEEKKRIEKDLSILKCKGRVSCIIPLDERRKLSTILFQNNKRSDEYYTRANTWRRFIEDHNLTGKTIFEPFYGDGSSIKVLNEAGVNVESKAGDFWDIITEKNCSKHFIMSNPPFSFKWLIIQTLLERKRNFALIMPFQMFYNSAAKRLNDYQEMFGGVWSKYELKSKEQEYYSLNDKKMIRIGTSILMWTF